MTHALSVRIKALEYLKKTNNASETSRKFGISPCTLKIWKSKRTTEELNPKRHPHLIIEEGPLRDFFRENPRANRVDAAKVFGTSVSTMCTAIKKFGIPIRKQTRKKAVIRPFKPKPTPSNPIKTFLDVLIKSLQTLKQEL